ncbi:Response regulator receiver domain-containing protein [Fontimonas thermophila]|uniref:Response regulator receiver domain-containing protein n=1 Tax=Fontimonas thermophila TaxID=1076937 RepID=A0A1I2HVU5_9GAMM|nr:response regulator transcription factor [Fontimonas thermophila]SFF33543.1 Response regulator receiver domain-containing protein [Fontimonas thermophila]
MRKWRTVLVDDNRPFLVLARHLLADYPQIDVIGEAYDGHQAVMLAETLRPDLLIMDLAMPGMGGLQATRLIKAQDKPPIILIASHYDDPAHREFVAQVGADGFINKQRYETEVIAFIRNLSGVITHE